MDTCLSCPEGSREPSRWGMPNPFLLGVLVATPLLVGLAAGCGGELSREEWVSEPTPGEVVWSSEPPDDRPSESHPVPPPQHLPDPVPDIVAMVQAEKPVELTVEAPGVHFSPGNEEIQATWRRSRLGDRDEAIRLYVQYADAHPGTPDAALALFKAAHTLVSPRTFRAVTLDVIGDAALRLAGEHPSHSLTPRGLYMYVKESIKALSRKGAVASSGAVSLSAAGLYEPCEEEWNRVFRATALLAGRYPEDTRGPECLLDVADVLREAPEGAHQAQSLYRLVSEWPDAWDARFRAYRALHDDAVARGDLDGAREIARKAVTVCAGKLSLQRHVRPHVSLQAEPGTPWDAMLRQGIPSPGEILIAKPEWEAGDHFVVEAEVSQFDESSGAWRPAQDDYEVELVEGNAVVHLLERDERGAFIAVASHAGEPWQSGAGFGVLGVPEQASPHPCSLLFLPRFPVREGTEVFLSAAGCLVLQEARVDGDRIAVTIQVDPKTQVRQAWSGEDAWWDEAELEYEARSLTSWSPGAYDVDPGWNRHRLRRCATRIQTAAETLPSGPKLEEEALRRPCPQRLDEPSRSVVLSRLSGHFSGEELTKLETQWRGEPYRAVLQRGEEEGPGLAEINAELDRRHRDTPYTGFRVRALWSPSEGDREPHDIHADRVNGKATLLIWDYNHWRWRLSPEGEELAPPQDIRLPNPQWQDDRYGAARVVLGQREGTTFVREADRIIAETVDGAELWRYTAPTRVAQDESVPHPGFPILADPRLVHFPKRDRILCGVGQRALSIGMGVLVSRAPGVGGGLLAVDLAGNRIYEMDTGYCDALGILPRENGKHLAVGIFTRVSTSEKRVEEVWLVALKAATGEQLWEKFLTERKQRHIRHDTHELLCIASASRRQERIVVSSQGRLLVFDAKGKQLAIVPDVQLESVADMDGDGIDELIVREQGADRTGALSILNLEGQRLWEGPERSWEFCGVEDLDGDGLPELLAIRKSRKRAVVIFGKE